MTVFIQRFTIFPAALAAVLTMAQGLAQDIKKLPSKVLVEKAVSVSDEIERKYPGRVEAINKVTIQPRVSGTLLAATFREGDMVKEGQLLFEIEDARYKASVQAAEAKIKQLEIKIDYAKNNYERQDRLAKIKAVSQDQVENSLSTLRELEAQLLQAKAELILAQEDLKYTRVYSPLTGRIGRLTYSTGNYITPTSQPLATITQVDPIYVRFPMSEKDFLSLFGNDEELRNRAELRIVIASGRTYPQPGTVAMSDNEVKSGTDSLNVWAQFDNPRQMLQPGGISTVVLNKKNADKVAAVTISAVQHDTQGSYIYVLDDKNTVVRRPVSIGSTTGNKQIITDGLKEGEIVIIDGLHKTRPGATVVPVFREALQQ